MELFIDQKVWPAAGTFRISRSALTEFHTLWITLKDGDHIGRGACRPYARYGDTVSSVTTQLKDITSHLRTGITPVEIQTLLPPGPARNALDCALWDLYAKINNCPIYELLDIPAPQKRQTAYTLSLDTPENMAEAARNAKDYPLLKIKIGPKDSIACVKAVCAARPSAALIVDANEALTANALPDFYYALGDLNIALIEQPLPAGKDIPNLLPQGRIPFCADESLHTTKDLTRLKAAGYRAVNVKLDKCGGLTEALSLMRSAKAEGFLVMAGCMVGSSLAMAPIMILESLADFIDLDGPLLLSKDCASGLTYKGPWIHPPRSKLWG